MKVIRLNYHKNNQDFIEEHQQLTMFKDGCCLTIGNFDGIHLGHQKIINQLKVASKKLNLPSVIITFEPHPFCFFKNISNNYRISTLANKIKLLSDFKIDYLVIIKFNDFFSKISAPDFITNFLEKKFRVKHLIIGYDFTFGKDRQGNFRDLENHNFSIEEINPVKLNIEEKNITCSSTLIRNLLAKGDIKNINKILNRNYSINGMVINGQKLAKSLGFPTANLLPKSKLIIPKFGVYQTITSIDNENIKYPSITNIGIKPSIANSPNKPLIETHILNFNKDIYGKKITVEFIDFIRIEKKFSNIEDLKQQIKKDINSIII